MSSEPVKILAFDIGIRNLAWCFMERRMDISGSLFVVKGWENVDLLASSQEVKQICSKCSSKATHSSGTCARHCPAERPALRDLSGALVKKLPPQKTLKLWFATRGWGNLPKSTIAIHEKLSTIASLPLEAKKKKKAVDTELSVLHDAIREFIEKQRELFRTATAIHLENQPVLKNPTMKTVQILLYATLRDILQPNTPVVRLVHAGVKVKGKTTGDKGYKERKEGSESIAKQMLKDRKVVESEKWGHFLQSHTKQNDLTDAFCMCVGALSV